MKGLFMGKADRKMKRKHSVATQSALTKKSVAELQKLPVMLEKMIKANESLVDENERIKETIKVVLEDLANKVAELRREVNTLKGVQNDEVSPSIT